jgi:hypothetical protein
VRGAKTLLFTPHPVLRTTLSLRARDSHQIFSRRLLAINHTFMRTRASLSVSKIYTLSIGDASR